MKTLFRIICINDSFGPGIVSGLIRRDRIRHSCATTRYHSGVSRGKVYDVVQESYDGIWVKILCPDWNRTDTVVDDWGGSGGWYSINKFRMLRDINLEILTNEKCVSCGFNKSGYCWK